jgi:hypothetical protein
MQMDTGYTAAIRLEAGRFTFDARQHIHPLSRVTGVKVREESLSQRPRAAFDYQNARHRNADSAEDEAH